MMINFGDFVKFKNSKDENIHEVISGIFYIDNVKCVILENYDGEVNIECLEKVEL